MLLSDTSDNQFLVLPWLNFGIAKELQVAQWFVVYGSGQFKSYAHTVERLLETLKLFLLRC